MKKLYLTALLALPLVAMPARADGLFPIHIEGGARVWFRVNCGGTPGGGAQLGPWYNYWPLEAHFVTPAPTGYPYWPQPQTLPPTNPYPPTAYPQVPTPPPDAKTSAGPEVKPVGYFYYPYPYQSCQPKILVGPAPSYWYSSP